MYSDSTTPLTLLPEAARTAIPETASTDPLPVAPFIAFPDDDDDATARLVSVGGQQYGIPVSQAREVVRVLRVTRIPGAPPVVRGMMNVRGAVVHCAGTLRSPWDSACRYVVVGRLVGAPFPPDRAGRGCGARGVAVGRLAERQGRCDCRAT